MTKKKKILISVAVAFGVLLIFYCALCAYLTNKGKGIVLTVAENFGVWEELPDDMKNIVPKELSTFINYREYHGDDIDEWQKEYYEDINQCGNFYTVVILDTAYVHYRYTHKWLSYDGELGPGSHNIPCTLILKFSGFQWKVVDYHEPP